MIELLKEDLASAPSAFDWRGPTDVEALRRWLKEHMRRVPDDLLALWARTGGGDMFETEEVLSPLAVGDHDLAATNDQLWAQGLPSELLVFHSGLYMTAIGPEESVIRVDSIRLTQVGLFDSMSGWYADLRGEYAETYDLNNRQSR